MSEWVWEPDDFAVLWFSDANDRIPGLLRYTSRFALRDDFERHRSTVRARYDSDEFERIELALHTLTTSDMRIEIFGGTSRYQGSDGTVRMYRIIGARNMYHAAILHQFTQGEIDGRIRLQLCHPDTLASRTAAVVPAREPGTHPPLTVHPDDVRDGRRSSTGNSAAERYRRLLSGPADGNGSAELLVGPFNTDPQPSNEVQWCDLPDGRYLRTQGEHLTLRPATTQDLAAHFHAWFERAIALQREQEYEPW
ncbi:ESX secretion-associated protein EspG [Nocardia blacklockiae]|uniref:ESX secretion-associated protein EspG n=1 Tax=Nocardia blacklockiae TaxID=480036 RepID=UPI0018940063|nr:ESX secretion-associated protein EspG [Nocardia blacklockiae]MBF6174654.1 ESX secretion-associated protein EspG [Nocardia blacklockiae]